MQSTLDREGYLDEAEGKASALRYDLGLGTDALGDVFELLGHLGLEVLRWPLGEDGPDGFYIRKDDLFVAAVNSSKRLGRQRFTACHELAHHVFDRLNHADTDVFAAKSVAERRANAFAAFFLMPREGVSRWLHQEGTHAGRPLHLGPSSVVHLAHHFGMSYEATLYQLRDLGRLSSRDLKQLRPVQPEKLARSLGYDVDADERERGRQVLPPRFVELALQAFGSGDVSLARLAELLRVDEEAADRIAAEAGIREPELSLDELAEEARHA